jgi:hypothetical protein
MSHGRGRACGLRCDSGSSSAMTWKVVGGVVFVIVLIIILAIFVGTH